MCVKKLRNLRAVMAKKQKNKQHLIINGCAVGVHVPVNHDLSFAGKARVCKPDLCVLHWTGGEGSGEQVHEVLRRRRLSVHFCIDSSGTIYQCDAGWY